MRNAEAASPPRELLVGVATDAKIGPLVVTGLDNNPLVVTSNGCLVVDARICVARARPIDPFLRQLRRTR